MERRIANTTRYIGTKLIDAVPMTRGEYNKYRGWTIPEDENPDDEGYLVIYSDSYESWSPKLIFEVSHRQSDNMPFGYAIEAMKKGYAVSRKGWNGKDMCIFYIKGRVVNGDVFQSWKNNANKLFSKNKRVVLAGHIDMKAAGGIYVTGWLASQTDMLADDWFIYKNKEDVL